MRHWLIALALLPSLALAGGPKYTYPGVRGLDDEMNNAYHDIRNVPNGIYASSSMTLQGLTVDSATVNSKLTIPNGAASSDAAAFGQIYSGFQAPIQRTTTATTSTSGTSYVTANLSASITPTSSAHRIKITISGNAGNNTSGGVCVVTIFRTSTDLSSGPGFSTTLAGAGGNCVFPVGISYIDSPATNSSVTYTVEIKSNGTGTATWNGLTALTTIILEEVI